MLIKITEENLHESEKYIQAFKKLGIDIRKGFGGLELSVDTDKFRNAVTRNAGRKTIGLKKDGYLVSLTVEEALRKISENGQEATAKEYGISRRTLMRRIKEAQDFESDVLL